MTPVNSADFGQDRFPLVGRDWVIEEELDIFEQLFGLWKFGAMESARVIVFVAPGDPL